MSIEPVNVEIERERAMTVTFDDDVVCVFPVEELRGYTYYCKYMKSNIPREIKGIVILVR